MSAIVVSHQSGLRFTAQIGAHQLVLDQSIAGGGEDAGPSPLDLLGASLGSCVALYVYKFLVARNLPTAGLRVDVQSHVETHPRRVSQFDVHITIPDDVPPVYRPMIEAVAHVCPAHHTLVHGAAMRIEVEALATTP